MYFDFTVASAKKQELVEIESAYHTEKFKNHTQRKVRRFKCKPSYLLKPKILKVIGISWEIKPLGNSQYLKVAGINKHDEVIWSEKMDFWEKKYLCKDSEGLTKHCKTAIGRTS